MDNNIFEGFSFFFVVGSEERFLQLLKEMEEISVYAEWIGDDYSPYTLIKQLRSIYEQNKTPVVLLEDYLEETDYPDGASFVSLVFGLFPQEGGILLGCSDDWQQQRKNWSEFIKDGVDYKWLIGGYKECPIGERCTEYITRLSGDELKSG